MDRRTIFGYDVGLVGDPSAVKDRVAEELALYPASSEDESVPLDIEFVESLPDEREGYVNPGIHVDLADGFIAHYGSISVRFHAREGRLVRVAVAPRTSSRFGDIRQRARHLQYTTVEEMMGQLLHELVLVPAAYFQDGMGLVHASAVQADDGSVTLIGGTGGVGKTSLELEFCRRRGLGFVADDIAVLDRHGHVWPNLSFPKIYGYNVVDDAPLKKALLAGTTIGNRLQWEVKHRRSPSRVRRRVSPTDLYGRHSTSGGPLKRYVIIVRDRSPGMDCRPLSAADAAHMSLAVIQTEYNVFDNQVRWHEFNRSAQGEEPIVAMQAVHAGWSAVYASTFSNVECLLIRASKDMDHKTFIKRAADMVTAEYEAPLHG